MTGVNMNLSGHQLVALLRDENFLSREDAKDVLLYAADDIEGLYNLVDQLMRQLMRHNWGRDYG